MADPLTSEDIIRERLGFGPSTPEERQRAAAAGISPLGTMERGRFERGGGISSMASKEEKEAWVAAEVMAGKRDPMELPKAYGGLGERPEATTRRGLRMQQEWDTRYKMMTEQQDAIRQAEMEQRKFVLSERNLTLQERQEARLQAAEAKAQEEASKISDDADNAMNELLGGVDLSGNTIAGLDPDDPNYMQRRNDIVKRYPKALKDDAFKTAISTTDKSYFDAINFNQQLEAQQKSAILIGERQEAATTRGEKERAAIREEESTKQEERDIKRQESDIDKQIRAQRQVLAGLQGQKPTRTLEKAATEASNKLLDLRIERAGLRGFAFEDQEAYKQAIDAGKKPPAGTTIYIGRKQVKVK